MYKNQVPSNLSEKHDINDIKINIKGKIFVLLTHQDL